MLKILYANYIKSRDAVWKLLIDLCITELPISITKLCNMLGIRVYSFRKMPGITDELLAHRLAHYDGHARFHRDKPIILFNDTMRSYQRMRFTVAHELGHILLNHIRPGQSGDIWTPTGLHRRLEQPITLLEQEANVFASRLLAPACVLWGVGAETPDQIMQLCGLSRQAAEYRAARMIKLYLREQHFLKTRGHSCFLQKPEECQVFEQFRPFIEKHKLY